MPLTPVEVHSVVFGKAPIGKRGYHEDEVDAFLNLVETELVGLIAENDDLRSQLEQLDQQQDTTRGQTGSVVGPPQPPHWEMAPPPPAAGPAAPVGDSHAQAARVLGLAQEMADRLTGQAKTDADDILSQARRQADQLLAAAHAKADGLVQEARTRAEALLTDARTEAGTLQRQAREKIASLERQAARQHSQTLATLNQEQNTLHNNIDRLRGLEREYRIRLKAHLTAQLHELDGDDTVSPPAPYPNGHGGAAFGPSAYAETDFRTTTISTVTSPA